MRVEMVDISRINVDPSYQRDLDEKRVASNAKAFQLGAAKAVSLSERDDGSLWAYDGQQTLDTFRRVGISLIPAVIVSGNQQLEARWFVTMNGPGVRKATQRESQKAGLVAGDELSAKVQSLLDFYRIELAKGGSRAGTTSAIGTLKSLAKKDCGRLDEAMGFINRLWSKADRAWTHPVIRGAWDVVVMDNADEVEKTLKRLKVTPQRILDLAAGMQAQTGQRGSGAGYAKRAFLTLANVDT